ncbi:HAD hydrolase-like protein [Mucilaginibacter aquariorum]|uniref:HAD hydrolase-like protein n=1 Tax=Mucilaginibacter aquariorum TaxID=2967225 RepID=A0ABT1T8P6_9SPHI|nr:HAD hydrolase-like protein [Mucilaginibacter aquariorum]
MSTVSSETDIRGGVQMGYKTILVLSGISTQDSMKYYAYSPDLTVGSIDQIKRPLKWWPKAILS